MGELIMIAMVVIVLVIVIGLIVWGRGRTRPGITGDNASNIATLTVRLPQQHQARVSAELAALVASNKPGTVEFYENRDRIVRLVVQ